MKKVKDFILREIANEYVLVPTGAAAQTFNGLITLNEQAVFLWERIELCEDVKALVKCLTDEYEVENEVAERDVKLFLSRLSDVGIINI